MILEAIEQIISNQWSVYGKLCKRFIQKKKKKKNL